MSGTEKVKNPSILTPVVIVAALGYFVDIYDLMLFSIVRKPSLEGLGFTGETLESNGILLLNLQMAGMLIGGIFWGILGDKKGRLSVLFGSILMYSIANVANGMVTSIEGYGFWRFIAGIGLAGELGAGITLVTEVMPKETRGYATTIVASIGIAGAVVGGLISDLFDWRTCYYIGGGLGLSLLALRIGVTESGMFKSVLHDDKVEKGDFLALFKSWNVLSKYLAFICIGLPVWYVVGILVTFSPEIAHLLGTDGVKAGKSVMYCYGGMVIGDILSGVLSQVIGSRKKILWGFWLLSVLGIVCYFSFQGLSLGQFYGICLFCGIGIGSWVVFMTATAEQFGTNIRATVTTTVPNFVRGAVIPMTSLYATLAAINGIGSITSAILCGILIMLLAAWGIGRLKETFGHELDFTEPL